MWIFDPRLRNSAMEVRSEHDTVHGMIDLRGAKGLAVRNDAIRIASEAGNVPLHLLEYFRLVQGTVITKDIVASSFVALPLSTGQARNSNASSRKLNEMRMTAFRAIPPTYHQETSLVSSEPWFHT